MRHNSIETTSAEPVSSHWEPCANFTAEAATSPVCTDCGWLAHEHLTAA